MWIDGLIEASLIAWYIGVLAFFEGLLSADNAIVLALMVKHLPKAEQRRVLYYGIWGAVGFRFIALLLAAILKRFWPFKVIGGGYLLYLAVSHFLSQKDDQAPSSTSAPNGSKPGTRNLFSSFWGTVVSVTLTDIAFSIDSILFAVGMADDLSQAFRGKLEACSSSSPVEFSASSQCVSRSGISSFCWIASLASPRAPMSSWPGSA